MLQEAMRRSMADAPPARPPAPRPPRAAASGARPPAAAAPPRRPAAGIIGARCELRVELDAGAFGRHEHPGRLCIDSRLVSLRFTLRAPAGWIANTEVELELEDASGRVPGDRTWAWRGNGQEAVRLVAGADGTYTTTRKLTVKALSSKFANRAFRLRANARVTDAQGSPGSLMNITDATEGFRVVSDTKTGKQPGARAGDAGGDRRWRQQRRRRQRRLADVRRQRQEPGGRRPRRQRPGGSGDQPRQRRRGGRRRAARRRRRRGAIQPPAAPAPAPAFSRAG